MITVKDFNSVNWAYLLTMQTHQIYYLQQMGYTVWKQKKMITMPSCQCIIANHGLDQATLLCCLDKLPNKSEKDLWIFLAMAFDFSQQYYLASSLTDSVENTVCPSCLEHWLSQSTRHHAISFGQCQLEKYKNDSKNLLLVPGLSDMLANPRLKKQCFMDIQKFLCQEHLVI